MITSENARMQLNVFRILIPEYQIKEHRINIQKKNSDDFHLEQNINQSSQQAADFFLKESIVCNILAILPFT